MSNPGLIDGKVPTAAEWNSYFDAKQDLLGFSPLPLSGGQMTGLIDVVASTLSGAGINISPGVAPTSPAAGDMWATGTGLFVRIGASTVALTGGAITGFAGGTLTGPLTTVASTTAISGLNVPSGTAPNTPNNGDIWVTSSGLFARINGVTINVSQVGAIDSLTLKATPAAADEVAIWDVAGAAIKKATINTLGPSNVLKFDTTATISKGYTLTPNNIGTVSSGTLTPDPTLGNYQYYTANGAHTVAAPASDCAIDILITNGASAGAISFSGFTVGTTGDALTTTNTNKFILSVRRINAVATYIVKALQ